MVGTKPLTFCLSLSDLHRLGSLSSRLKIPHLTDGTRCAQLKELLLAYILSMLRITPPHHLHRRQQRCGPLVDHAALCDKICAWPTCRRQDAKHFNPISQVTLMTSRVPWIAATRRVARLHPEGGSPTCEDRRYKAALVQMHKPEGGGNAGPVE